MTASILAGDQGLLSDPTPTRMGPPEGGLSFHREPALVPAASDPEALLGHALRQRRYGQRQPHNLRRLARRPAHSLCCVRRIHAPDFLLQKV